MRSVLVLGAQVYRSAFFGKAEEWVCLGGHPRPTAAQERCSIDHAPFFPRVEWVPTEFAVAIARKSGFTTAEDWWGALKGDPSPELPLGRYCVAPTQAFHEREGVEVLGLRVGGVDEERPAYMSLHLGGLLKTEAWISVHLDTLGLGSRQIYLWNTLVTP